MTERPSTSPGRVRLGWVRAWAVVALVATVVPGTAYVVGAVRFPHRPWYPLLAVLTLGFGVIWLRALRRQAGSVELDAEGRHLVVRGLGWRRVLDLGDLRSVEMQDHLFVKARCFNRHFVVVTLGLPDRQVCFRTTARDEAKDLVDRLAQAGTPVGDADPRISRMLWLDHSEQGLEHLNPAMFASSPAMLVAVSFVGAAMVFAAIFAAPLAFWKPPLVYDVQEPGAVVADLQALADGHQRGVERAAPSVVTSTRPCERKWVAWFGEEQGHRVVTVTTALPVDRAAVESLPGRLESRFGQGFGDDDHRTWGGYYGHVHLDAGLTRTGERHRLEVSAYIGCLSRAWFDGGGRATLERHVAAVASSLATT